MTPPTCPVGVVGSWYGATLDPREVEVFRSFPSVPVLRATIATPAHAVEVLDVYGPSVGPLLLVEREDDALIQQLPAALAAAHSAPWGIELGNELNFSESPWPFGQFVTRSHRTLRAGGYEGRIVSGGIGNLERKTLAWLRVAMLAGRWPDDVLVGWHAYSEWGDHVEDFLRVIGDRPHAMTEWGYTAEQFGEQEIAVMTVGDLELFREMGAQCAVWYQIADGPEGVGFGLHTYDWRWRPTLNALRGTPGASLP